ncbi:MAG: hypothetical protein ING01_09475 [Rhodobacter sp.]|nr:hypothetical protein [Rhodobacter sp.]
MTVEPVGPARPCHPGGGLPRPLPPDHPGFAEVIGGLGGGVVMTVAEAALSPTLPTEGARSALARCRVPFMVGYGTPRSLSRSL